MKTIEVTTILNAQDEDVLRFKLEPDIDVVLTTSNGAAELKEVFCKLLQLMRSEDIGLQYIDTPEYTNEMYKSVSREYIQSLATEIQQARNEMKQEGIITEV